MQSKSKNEKQSIPPKVNKPQIKAPGSQITPPNVGSKAKPPKISAEIKQKMETMKQQQQKHQTEGNKGPIVDLKLARMRQASKKLKESLNKENQKKLEELKKKEEQLDRLNSGIFYSNMIYNFLKEFNQPKSKIVNDIQNRIVHINQRENNYQNIEIKVKGQDYFNKKEQEKIKQTSFTHTDNQTSIATLNRLKYTEQEKERMRMLKESTGNWQVDKKELSEIEITRQEIFLLLNQLTLDNYDEFKDNFMKHLDKLESCTLLVQLLVEKVLNEKLFSVLYCRLIQYLNDKKVKITDSEDQTFKKLVSHRINHLNDFGFTSLKRLKEEHLEKVDMSHELRFEELNFKRQRIMQIAYIKSLLSKAKVYDYKVIQVSILYNLREFLKEHFLLKSNQQKVSIQDEYFEQTIKLFEYLGRDILTSVDLQWKSQDKQLSQQVLKQLVDLKQGKITVEQCLDESLQKKTHQCHVDVDFVLFNFYKEIKGQGYLSKRLEILMENLEDFRKTGYTKNLFEAKVAMSSSQVNQSQGKVQRKQSSKIEVEEEEDEDVIKEEGELIQEMYDLIQRRKNNYELNGFLEQMFLFDDCIELAMEQFLLFYYQGVHDNQTWVMRQYCYRAFENGPNGQPRLKPAEFYQILKNVFTQIVFDYQDYPMFIPEITAILHQLIQDKKINKKDLIEAIKPDDKDEDYDDMLELYETIVEKI